MRTVQQILESLTPEELAAMKVLERHGWGVALRPFLEDCDTQSDLAVIDGRCDIALGIPAKQ